MGVRSRYSLRGGRRWLSSTVPDDQDHDLPSDQDLAGGSDAATVMAGLKPGLLVLNEEKKRYSGNRLEYIEARNYVLQKWWSDPTRYLSESVCLKGVPDERRRFVREVYRFLQHHGCINFGVLKDDPAVTVPEGLLPTQKKEENDGAADSSEAGENDGKTRHAAVELTDGALEDKLYELLATCDLEQVTEKQLRRQLAEHFATDMTEKKSRVRELVTGYLQEGCPPKAYRERKAREEKAEAAAQVAVEEEKKSRMSLGKVIVIGAGPSGLSAALHLKRNKVDVTVLEARERIGGRVHSHMAPGFSAPVDLGASIITGTQPELRRALRPDPSSVLCTQLGISLHHVDRESLPLHDAKSGGVIERAFDDEVEKLMNDLMDEADDLLENLPDHEADKASFGEMLDKAVQARLGGSRGNDEREMDKTSQTVAKAEAGKSELIDEESATVSEVLASITSQATEKVDLETFANPKNNDIEKPSTLVVASENVSKNTVAPSNSNAEEGAAINEENTTRLTEDHLRLLQWHWAHAEYGCSAPLHAVSAKNWNQDEEFGGFGGPHCMVVGGFDAMFRKISELLDVRQGKPVVSVRYRTDVDSVEVMTKDGESFWADAVIVTVPLGVLKADSIAFDPPLPEWKQEAINRLGFGALNKIVLEFPSVFWDDTVDFFGAIQEHPTPADRGWCFMFWNFHRFSGAPILAALVSGEAAHAAEYLDNHALQDRAMACLKSIYPSINIPEPVACTVSRWSSDPFARGSYSFVAVGASGDDYDLLARPVLRRILFAGEHTAREHPDTVGGAMLSGLREASRALDILAVDRRDKVPGAAEVSEAVKAIAAKRKVKKRPSSNEEAKGSVQEKNRSQKHRRKDLGGGGSSDGSQWPSKKSKRWKGDEEEGKEFEEKDVDDSEDDTRNANWKFDLALGRDVARRQEELRQREAAREASKAIWRGLMTAEIHSNTSEILEAMNLARDINSRQNVAMCLTQANRTALQAFASDVDCVGAMISWLEVSAHDSAQISLVDALLQALKSLAQASHALSHNRTLRSLIRQKCVVHSDPSIRKTAIGLMRIFERSNNGSASGSGAGRDDVRRSTDSRSRFFAKNGESQEQKGEGIALDTRSLHRTSSPAVQLDPETQARLDVAAARVQELKAKAEKLHADAEAAQAALAASQSDDLLGPSSRIMSFEEFRRAEASARKRSGRDDETTKASARSQSHQSDVERLSSHEEQAELAKRDSSLGGRSISAATEPHANDSRRGLDKLIVSILEPHYRRKHLTKEQYKSILRRAGDKVWERASESERSERGKHWFGGPKKKIQQLVEAYVASMAGKRPSSSR